MQPSIRKERHSYADSTYLNLAFLLRQEITILISARNLLIITAQESMKAELMNDRNELFRSQL